MSENTGNPSPTTLTLATTTEALAQLSRLVKHLRSLGVAQYAMADLTLSIAIDEPPEFQPEMPPAPAKEAKRGKDGLTAADQEMLYGWVDGSLRE